jgi:hypothetical protein
MSIPSKYVPGPQAMPFAAPNFGASWQQPSGAPPQAPNGTQMMTATPWGQPPAAPGGAPWQGQAPPIPPNGGAWQGGAYGNAAEMPRAAAAPVAADPAWPQAPAPRFPQGSQPHYGSPPATQQPHAPPAAQQPHAPPAAQQPYAPHAAQHYGAPPAAPAYGSPPAAPAYGAPPAAQHYAPPPAAQAYGPPAAQPYGPPPAAQPYGPPPAAPAYGAPPAAGHAGPGVAQAPSAVAGCAHNYPLAVRTTGLIAATKLSLKTLSYALFRFGYSSLFAALGMLQLCVVGGLAYVLSTYVHLFAGAAVMLVGLLAFALVWWPFVERKMFATWCGHIAILTELITKGQINNGGRGMFAFGRELVAARLGELETLWDANRAINKALRRMSNVLNFADDLLPIDLGPVKRLLGRVVAWVAPYVEGVIVSYGLARGDRDFKAAGADGLCYSAQNAKSLFKTAFGVLVLEQVALLPVWVAALVTFVPGAFYVAFAATGGDVGVLLNANAAAIQNDMLLLLAAACVGLVVGGVFSLLAVKTVKEAFVKPTLLTMVMLKFHAAIENQPLDQGVKARVLDANAGLAQLDGARAMLRRAGV